MISKSAAALFMRQSGKAAQTKYAALTVAHQRNFAGGGPKKPAMPASNMDFDIVFVGNIIFHVSIYSIIVTLVQLCGC